MKTKNISILQNFSSIGNISLGKIKYLLLDTFNTNLAAGSVNNTKAEPTGQTRVVTDTNTKISITGGQLSFATGQAINDGVWYASTSRILGRILMADLNITTGRLNFGFDNNQSGGINGSSMQLRDTNIIGNNGSTYIVGTLANSTAYKVAIVLRTNGSYLFIKGGAFTNWSLLSILTDNVTSSLFPAISSNTTTSVFVADNIRMPSSAFIPMPLVYDTFTRANGALGSSETKGPDSQAVGSKAWTDTLGTWAITTNVAGASALSGGSAFETLDSGVADILIDVAFTRSAGVGGVVLRYADSSNYIIAYHDGTNAKLDKVIGGSTTNVKSAVAAYSAGASIRVVAFGTTFILFYNNVAISTPGTISDAAVQSTTLHGLYTTDTGNTFDNFLIMPRGTNNEYSALNQF